MKWKLQLIQLLKKIRILINKEAQESLEKSGEVDYTKVKFDITKHSSPKYGDAITCSCPFSCRKAYLSEKSFIKLLKHIKKYYNGTV